MNAYFALMREMFPDDPVLMAAVDAAEQHRQKGTTMSNVIADPKRPYKAYAAAAIAFLGLLWANLQGVEDWGSLGFQDWMTIIVPTILTFGGTYLVQNPKTTALMDRRP